MSKYLNLTKEMQREFVYELLRSSIAAHALANVTGTSAEIWADRLGREAMQQIQGMSKADIADVLEQYDQASQGHGPKRVEIRTDKGFGNDAQRN